MKRLPAILAFLAMAAQAVAAPEWRVTAFARPPAPGEQRAEVSVAGTTSTLVGALDVARIPRPASDALSCGDFVGDTDGFAWFCSRHWAVKTDLGDDGAARILELLELAWPQYAAVFGATPPPGRRLTLVAASSRDALKRVLIGDGMFSFTLGGVTQEGYGCSYLYAGTPYQTRYIVLHEATHLFQYCLSGNTRGAYGFFVEGVADYLSSHIYDPVAHTLAVNVLDRAPIHNHLANGLEAWRAAGEPSFSTLYGDPEPARGTSVLLTAFLQSTPDYAARWRDYCRRAARREGFGADGAKAASDALLGELYGGAAALDAPFRDWMRALAPSYRLARREFDQEGRSVFASCVPASPEAPAVLEWRGGPVAASPSVRWRDPPENGAFAKVELWPAQGGDAAAPVTCVVTNAPLGQLAFVERNGVRDLSVGGRRLHAALRLGEAVCLGDFTVGRWRLTASQPGVVFDMAHDRGGAPEGPAAAAPAPPQVAAPAIATDGTAPLSFQVLGPFALRGGAFGPCGAAPPPTPVDLTAVHTLDDGTFAVWREAVARHNAAFSATPIANLTATFGRQANNAFAYAWTALDGGDGGEREFVLGVSDGIEAFVNGRAVLNDVRHREWQDGNVRFRTTLRPGRNELLLRLTHGCGVWLLSAGLKIP